MATKLLNQKEGGNILTHNFLFSKWKQNCLSLSVSLFWTEKIMIIVQALQLFMLVFAANFDNWPKLWVGIVDKNFPGLLVTLDFATFFYEDIVDEDDDGNFARHLYAYGWLGACAILAAVFGIVWGCLAKYPIGRVIFTRAALTIGHIMMIPIGLGLMPMALCTYDGCWSGVDVNQMIILILSMAVFVIYLVFLPYYNL